MSVDEAARLLFFSRYDALPNSDSSVLVVGVVIARKFDAFKKRVGIGESIQLLVLEMR